MFWTAQSTIEETYNDFTPQNRSCENVNVGAATEAEASTMEKAALRRARPTMVAPKAKQTQPKTSTRPVAGQRRVSHSFTVGTAASVSGRGGSVEKEMGKR